MVIKMKSLTYIEVNVKRIRENIKNILAYKEGAFMFILKANAYGHGYLKILEIINSFKQIKYIGVSNYNEATLLARYTKKEIVILGYTKNSYFINKYSNIIPSISNESQLDIEGARVFVNINTGFNRLGLKPTKENYSKLIQFQKNNDVVGIFTHLKLSSNKEDFLQIDSFKLFTSNLEINYNSISDSIAYTRYNTNENLYRIGALMYGLTSNSETGKINVKPTDTLYSTITNIEYYNKDTEAFYHSFIAKNSKVATIQIGYGDGLFRDMKDVYVMINDTKCNYIEVGMDQSIVDITDVNCEIGDEVIVFGNEGISLEEMSKLLGTNKNNILTNISQRVSRKYVGGAK